MEYTGTVKQIDVQKGFGFIRAQHGDDYFFHKSACRHGAHFPSLREGDRVAFTPSSSPKGLRAEEVRVC
jgi:cold shock CspA family protein